jgi:ABC-type multidrug transport system fused ATPase/permease subunit
MNNLISIFHLLSFSLTIINCAKSSTKKTSLPKNKPKSLLPLIIGITVLILIILSLILLLIFYFRKRVNNRTKSVQRQMKEYDMPIVTYNINEFDTIRTVGTASEFKDYSTESEIQTVI